MIINSGILIFSIIVCSLFVYLIDFEKNYFERMLFVKSFNKIKSLSVLFPYSRLNYMQVKLPFEFNISIKNNELYFESAKFYLTSKVKGINNSFINNSNIFSINKTKEGIFLC